ncbi:MAG: hypothetical protein R2711_14825 [Acidimicrobiales bacterium]
MIDTAHDLVRTDFALTEVGGAARRTPDGLVVDAAVSDKGMGVIGIVPGAASRTPAPTARTTPS